MPLLKNIITGAAVGSFIGSLSVALYPKRRKLIENVADKAKEYADSLLTGGGLFAQRKNNQNGLWGSGLAGILLGAGTALLLAPTTGKQMRSQLLKTYSGMYSKTKAAARHLQNNERPQPYRHANSARPAARRKSRTRSRISY